MYHRISGRKLGRTSSHVEAMLANQATSLIRHGRIRTTVSKAKELKRVVEKLITTAKEDSVHARRQVAKIIQDKDVVKKLFAEVAPEFKERPGGYTQIFQLGPRKSDGAPMSFIQLVGFVKEEKAAE